MARAFHLLNRKTTNCWSIPFGHHWHMACPALNSTSQTSSSTWEPTSSGSSPHCLGYLLRQLRNLETVNRESRGLCSIWLIFSKLFATRWNSFGKQSASPLDAQSKTCSAHSWFEACGAVFNQSNFGDKGIGLSSASAFLTCHGNVTDVLEPVKCPLPSEVGPFFPLLTGGENI